MRDIESGSPVGNGAWRGTVCGIEPGAELREVEIRLDGLEENSRAHPVS